MLLTREQMPAVVLAALDQLRVPMEAVVSVTLDCDTHHVVPGGAWHVLLWCGMQEARNTALLATLQSVETRCDGSYHTAICHVCQLPGVNPPPSLVALSWTD
jgi:hypothetical protein